MDLVGAAPPDLALFPASPKVRHASPCVFGRSVGFVHSAAGSIGIVLCSPWGFEDLLLRKSWRVLAEAIAAAGYPCIRFDYPGTGNAAGAMNAIRSRDEWVASIHDAADVLRRTFGIRRYVFVGQSLGAALAAETAAQRDDVEGLCLIAPVVKGRAYVRELAATSRLVADRVGVALPLGRDEGLGVVGFSLSTSMTDSVKGIDLLAMRSSAVRHAAVFDASERKTASDLVMHFGTLGIAARLAVVPPYRLMVSDAIATQSLPVDPADVVAVLRADHPDAPIVRAAPRYTLPTKLSDATFDEVVVRFGAQDALFGVLCRPAVPRPGSPVVVLLNRGLNAHIGWRRVSVDQARGLAAAGIASLRIDLAGLGESRDDPTRAADLIYADVLAADVSAALDFLESRGFGNAALAGVCSGAYLALLAAKLDPRVRHVVAVNAQRLVWNPAEKVDDVVRYGLRSIDDYVGDIRSKGAFRKLIRSRARIVPALRFLVANRLRRVVSILPFRARALVTWSMAGRVRRSFSALETRNTRVSLVYSDNDPGLNDLRAYFGHHGRSMPFKNVSVSVVEGVDHNLTSTTAATWMLDHLSSTLGGTSPKLCEGQPLARSRSRETAVCGA